MEKTVFIKHIFFGLLLFLVVVGALWLVTRRITRISDKKPDSSSVMQQNTPGQPSLFLNPSQGTENTVAPDSVISHITPVRYSNGKFSPATILAKEEGSGVGCFIDVVNQSAEQLTIRLGPYEQGKEKGFLYAPIPPGQSAIIDPRYSGMDQAIFYSTHDPAEQFTVVFGKGCR